MSDEDRTGRRSTDVDLAVLGERLDGIEATLENIHTQTTATAGRVSELEVKERIRQDREEQKAIVSAASEAAKFRVEQQNVQEREFALQKSQRKLMLVCAAIGAAPGAITVIVALIIHS